MTTELKNLVFDDLENLEMTANDEITMFKIGTNHMALSNQESIDSLHNWIRTFDIQKVSGGNLSITVTQYKAVIRALGGFSFPANVLRCLLDEFAHASNEPFK